MATTKEQGTGKHPHKSAEEPFEHHEAGKESGKHAGTSGKESESSAKGSQAKESTAKETSESGSDLKSLEYTDAQGNVHHHTTKYEEQHSGRK